jgi:hypothetical protein
MTSEKLETIFEQFLKERTYLQGSGTKTLLSTAQASKPIKDSVAPQLCPLRWI